MTTLYRFFDASGALLYVGIAGRFSARLRAHRREAPWYAAATSITLERFETRAEAEAAERAAIVSERPAHNVQHNSGKPVLLVEPQPTRRERCEEARRRGRELERVVNDPRRTDSQLRAARAQSFQHALADADLCTGWIWAADGRLTNRWADGVIEHSP